MGVLGAEYEARMPISEGPPKVTSAVANAVLVITANAAFFLLGGPGTTTGPNCMGQLVSPRAQQAEREELPQAAGQRPLKSLSVLVYREYEDARCDKNPEHAFVTKVK